MYFNVCASMYVLQCMYRGFPLLFNETKKNKKYILDATAARRAFFLSQNKYTNLASIPPREREREIWKTGDLSPLTFSHRLKRFIFTALFPPRDNFCLLQSTTLSPPPYTGPTSPSRFKRWRSALCI